MAPQKSDQVSSFDEIPHSVASKMPAKLILNPSVDRWVAQIIQIVGQISASSTIFNQKTPSGKAENVTFSQADYHIDQLLQLLKGSIFQTTASLSQITDFGEEDLPKIISSITQINELQAKFQGIKKSLIEVLDLIDFSQFSYCSSCPTLEKTLDFALCDTCHSLLIKGQEIRPFLLHNYFSKELPYPVEIIQTLHQRFKSAISEVSYEVKGIEKKRQLVEIPVELNLNPSSTYQFFVIDDTHELIPLNASLEEKYVDPDQQKPDHEICRECGSKMRFLRSTMYYETSADLFQCPKCKMEKMINFKPIWESNIKDPE